MTAGRRERLLLIGAVLVAVAGLAGLLFALDPHGATVPPALHFGAPASSQGGPRGGGGFAGTWAPGTYSAGQIVIRKPFLVAAATSTSVDPCLQFGNLGDPSVWQYENVATNDITGGSVTLIAGVNGASAMAFYKTNTSGWDKKRLLVDATINGTADAFQFGIFDGSLTIPTTGSLNGNSGVWGVELDIYNGKVAPLINGVRDGLHDIPVRVGAINNTFLAAYDRWYLDLVDNGAGAGTMTMTLYRNLNSSSYSGHASIPENPFDDMGGPAVDTQWKWASWTITRPTFTNWKYAVGARTGGANGTFVARRAFARDTSGAWTVLGLVPDRQ